MRLVGSISKVSMQTSKFKVFCYTLASVSSGSGIPFRCIFVSNSIAATIKVFLAKHYYTG